MITVFFRYHNALRNFPLATESELEKIIEDFMVTERFVSLRKGLSVARNRELKNKINNEISKSEYIYKKANKKNKIF